MLTTRHERLVKLDAAFAICITQAYFLREESPEEQRPDLLALEDAIAQACTVFRKIVEAG